MRITEQLVAQAFTDLKAKCGGVRNDYFGLLYIQYEHDLPREQAIEQVAFGGNDYGIDGFHFDKTKRNLYLFQFKYSESHAQFKESFKRLIDAGMQYIFDATKQDPHHNQLIKQIKSCILENSAIIDRVFIHFVFLGDPQTAEASPVLDKLREDLENKKYLVEHALGRPLPLVIEFRSTKTTRVGGGTNTNNHTYPLHLSDPLSRDGPVDAHLHVGFVRLVDLHAMYLDMGQRFFERNIRASLPAEGSVNRSLERALKRIVLAEQDLPQVFAFNHNGVTLSAEALKSTETGWRITEPRLLNGAQTVTTFARFLKANEVNPRLEERKEAVEALSVLCRVVTGASPDFVTSVTVNNNRQNWVKPWNLRANDMIQLELQEKFRDDLNLYYERQERAFENLSDEELEKLGVTRGEKKIELFKLGQTFLVVDGDLDKLNRYPEVFEDDQKYEAVFSEARKKADSRKIVMCYKVERRLKQFVRDILETGQNKYEFLKRARNLLWALLCQGMLNDPKLEQRVEQWGHTLSVESDFVDWLSTIATTRVRLILKDLIEDKQVAPKVAEGNFNFLRTNATYKRAMEMAYKRYKWLSRGLK